MTPWELSYTISETDSGADTRLPGVDLTEATSPFQKKYLSFLYKTENKSPSR